MQVAFVTGPEEYNEPFGGVSAKPYKARNSTTFWFFWLYPFLQLMSRCELFMISSDTLSSCFMNLGMNAAQRKSHMVVSFPLELH